MNPERQLYMNAAMAGSDHGLGYTTVPMGWNRTIWGDGSVVYVSPSGHLLHCAEDLQRYLLAEGTCKCGLECPLIIDRVFNFNPRVPARPKLPADVLAESQLNTLCKHRNKLVAMAIGLQGNEETLANIGPPGGSSVVGRSKGSKRSRSKSKPERGVDFKPQNLSASQVMALQGGHMHQVPGIANFMPSLKSLPFEHQLQQHSIESQQRQIQMHLLQMQHQELMQQHQQMQHQIHHQHRQVPMRRRSHEIESLHSPVEQYSLEPRSGKRFHSSPPTSCTNRLSPNSSSTGSQSAPTSASAQSTAPRCSKSPRLSRELMSPTLKERQPLHGHGSLPFPFHSETHQLIVDGQTLGNHPDSCTPSVIPLLSNMYHAQNRASLNAANVSNSPAVFANNNDEVVFMQDGSRKEPSRTVNDSVEAPTSQPEETNKLESKSSVVSKTLTMHSTKPDKKLTVGNMTLQQIFKQSLEGSAFPASSLLSAAARAQLAKQPQSPDSPSPHHAGDLMSGMGLFNKISTNFTSKDSSGALSSNKSAQFSASRKPTTKSTNVDAVPSTDTNIKDASPAPQHTDESPIQCLENAVQNLKDHPCPSNPAADGSSPEVAQDSPASRKRASTEGIEQSVDKSVKRQRLQSSDSVESQAKQSEATMSTHQVPVVNSDKLLSMHHDTTKVTGSYNVVCSTGKGASSSKHLTAENAELARWQQQQQEWYANMLRVEHQHEAGNLPVESFSPGSLVRPPQIRSRGLQELQYIAMGGNPSARVPALQHRPHMGHMHRYPNHFMNPQFNPHQANMMHQMHRMQLPLRMDHSVDPADPNIPQNPSMCNSNILQSMLQQQQQLQQLGVLPPGNFQHPMHHMNPMHHLDPAQHIAQAAVPNLPKTQGHGQDGTKPGAASQHKKVTKPARAASTSTSTAQTCIADIDDEEPKDAAYWVKAASKSGGVKKVKDILAMTRSLKKHNSEAGQVEAIFQAVLDSASGGMKVIIKEGPRSQEGVQSESADTNQGKESDTPSKATSKSKEKSDSVCEVPESSSVPPHPAPQNAVEPNVEVQDESIDDSLTADAVEKTCGEISDHAKEPDVPTSQGEFRKEQNLCKPSVSQIASNPDAAFSQTKDLESVNQSEGDHHANPIQEKAQLEPEDSCIVSHQENVEAITCDEIHTKCHDLGSSKASERVSPPVGDSFTVCDQIQSIATADKSTKVLDNPQPAISQRTTVSDECDVQTIKIKDSTNEDEERIENFSQSNDFSEDESKVRSDVKHEEDPPRDPLLEHAEEVSTRSNEHGSSVHEKENLNYSGNPASDSVAEVDMEDISSSNDVNPLDAENIGAPEKEQVAAFIGQVGQVQSTGAQSQTSEWKDSVETQPPLDAEENISSDINVDLPKEGKSPYTSSSLPPPDRMVDTAESSVEDQRIDDTAMEFFEEVTSVQHSNNTGNDITVLDSGDTGKGSDVDCASGIMDSRELNSSPDMEVERQVKPVTAEEHEEINPDAVKEPEQVEQAVDVQPINSSITIHHEVTDNQPLDSTVDSELLQNSPEIQNTPGEHDATDDNQVVDQDSALGTKLSAQTHVEDQPESSQPVKQMPVDQQDLTGDSTAVCKGEPLDSETIEQNPNEDDVPVMQNPTEEDLPMKQDTSQENPSMKQYFNEGAISTKEDSCEGDLSLKQNPDEGDLSMEQDPEKGEQLVSVKQDPSEEVLSLKQNPDERNLPVSVEQDLDGGDLATRQGTNEGALSIEQDPDEEDLRVSVQRDPSEGDLPMTQEASEESQPMKENLIEDDRPIKQDSERVDQPVQYFTEDQPMKHAPTEDQRVEHVPAEEDQPVEHVSAEDQPVEQVPAEDQPVEQVSAEDQPVEQVSAEDQPVEQVPAEDQPVEQVSAEDQPVEHVPAEEDQPMKHVSAEDQPVEQVSAEDQPVEHAPAEDQPVEQVPTEDQPVEQVSAEDQPVEHVPAEEDQPMKYVLTEEDQPMKYVSAEDQQVEHAPAEDQQVEHVPAEEDQPMKHAPTEEDQPMKYVLAEDQQVEHAPAEEDQPMKHVSTDDQLVEHVSTDDQPIKDVLADEDQPMKDVPTEDQPMKHLPTEDQPVEHVSTDDQPIKDVLAEEDQPMKDVSTDDQQVEHVPTKEDQPVKQDCDEEGQPMEVDADNCDQSTKDIHNEEHQPLNKDSTEDHQSLEQDLRSSSDSEKPMDTEPVLQDLGNMNQLATQDPVIEDEQVQQDEPVHQDKMDDKPMDSDPQPMDIQPEKLDHCLDKEHLKQDHAAADENPKQKLSSSKEPVETVHPMDLDQVRKDHTDDVELDSLVENEPVTQDQFSKSSKEANIDESVRQRHLDNSESSMLDTVENSAKEDKFADGSPQEQCHVKEITSVKQLPVDICGQGSSEISKALSADHVTSSSIERDDVVKDDSGKHEKSMLWNQETTNEVRGDSNEQIKEHDSDTGMLDNAETSEPVKMDCFAEIKPTSKEEQNTSELEVQNLSDSAETSQQTEDQRRVKQNQTVPHEPEFGNQLMDCEDNTEPIQEDKVDRNPVCTTLDTSCENRDMISDHFGSEIQPSQVIEDTTCSNKSLSSREDESSDELSSSMSSPKLGNTSLDSNNPVVGVHTVEMQPLEKQDADLASETSCDRISSGAILGTESVPEEECLRTLEADPSHTAADSEAEGSTVPTTLHKCPIEDIEHNLPANISSEASSENQAPSETKPESSPVLVNGPPSVNMELSVEDPTSDPTSQTEMMAASLENSISETLKDTSSLQSPQHSEIPTPNGILESEHLNDIPKGSTETQQDKLTYQGISERGKQSTSDDERENRENKPLMTDEPPVQEICSVKRESNLKRGVSETQKAVLSAKEAGLKKERLVQEAPTRVLRGNVRADPSSELTASMFPRHLEIGDLVWGPIRGYPSWPGKLVSEAEVRGRSRREEGKMWVRWFGDHSCSQVEPEKLKTLSEGLEAHHSARQSYRSRGRRMNSTLEAAIQEAMNELDKKMEQAKGTKSKSVPKSSRPKTRCKRLR